MGLSVGIITIGFTYITFRESKVPRYIEFSDNLTYIMNITERPRLMENSQEGRRKTFKEHNND